MGRDKRGVSAKFLQRELGVAYQTAWTMAHKLRHGLGEDPRPCPNIRRVNRPLMLPVTSTRSIGAKVGSEFRSRSVK
jgi:hypothetical protein